MKDTAIVRSIREEKRNILMAAFYMNCNEWVETLLKFQRRNEEYDSQEMNSAAV